MPVPRNGAPRALKSLLDWLTNSRFNLDDSVEVRTATLATQQVSLSHYQTQIIGRAAGDPMTIGNGTGVVVGTRKLLRMTSRPGSSTVVFDHANIKAVGGGAATAVVFDAVNEFALLEWRNDGWYTIAASAGVVS